MKLRSKSGLFSYGQMSLNSATINTENKSNRTLTPK